MKVEDLKVKIFADGADIEEMKSEYAKGVVSGFTTNPTLMKKAGIKDYMEFAKRAVKEIPDKPLSFEVFSDDFDVMEREADVLAGLGDNVYVKIPITNMKGESSMFLIKRLSNRGVPINVTAIFTLEQTLKVVDALCEGKKNIVSVFAGRIMDAGVDGEDMMRAAKVICNQKGGIELLWASSREVYNVVQADRCGVDIITVTGNLLKKLHLLGKDLTEFSLETVRMLTGDGLSLGYSILSQ